jgi:TRAP-type C4-dicarboxylate transport system permease small subunit
LISLHESPGTYVPGLSAYGKETFMKKILETVFHYVEVVCKVLMIIQVIAVSIVVIGRQVFSKTPAWGEEITLFALVWVSMLGSAILLKNDGHISVTAFDQWLPKKVIRVLDLISYLFLMFFAVMMVFYGFKLIELTSRNVLPALQIKSSWLYASVPISSIGMILILIEKIYLLLRHKDPILS